MTTLTIEYKKASNIVFKYCEDRRDESKLKLWLFEMTLNDNFSFDAAKDIMHFYKNGPSFKSIGLTYYNDHYLTMTLREND